MIVFEVQVVHVATGKSKCDPPVAANGNCPLVLSITFESMEIETVRIYVSDISRGVKHVQAPSDSHRQLRLNASTTSCLKELLEPFVTERSNHPWSPVAKV